MGTFKNLDKAQKWFEYIYWLKQQYYNIPDTRF